MLGRARVGRRGVFGGRPVAPTAAAAGTAAVVARGVHRRANVMSTGGKIDASAVASADPQGRKTYPAERQRLAAQAVAVCRTRSFVGSSHGG